MKIWKNGALRNGIWRNKVRMGIRYMNNHIYSTLFKTQERESDRSKEIEQRNRAKKGITKNNNTKLNNKDM